MSLRRFTAFPTLFAVIVLVMHCSVSCSNQKQHSVSNMEGDSLLMNRLQGSWEDEYIGNVVFTIQGDTIFYNDSLSAPAPFFIKNDTLFVGGEGDISYILKKITASTLVLASYNGEELSLVRCEKTLRPAPRSDARVTINQHKKIKRDTVMTYGGRRYHAYSQVNPTTYRVYRQTTNPDGLNVESVYYDNIVYIGVYGEKGKIFSQDFHKQDFSTLVPQNFLSDAVLSEILFDKATVDGVSFIAVLAIPDSETSYRININISPDGEKTLTLK